MSSFEGVGRGSGQSDSASVVAMESFLKVSLIILYDSARRFLLQHRTEDAPRLAGFWAFFGGSIDDGEDAERAVYREALEELGYHLKNPKLVFQQRFSVDGQVGFMNVFVEHFTEDKSLLELREGQGWGWFSQREMAPLRMVDHDRVVIAEIESWLDEEDGKGSE